MPGRQQLERDEASLRALARTAPRCHGALLLARPRSTTSCEAIAHYRRALAPPDDPGIHFELGWFCRHVGLMLPRTSPLLVLSG